MAGDTRERAQHLAPLPPDFKRPVELQRAKSLARGSHHAQQALYGGLFGCVLANDLMCGAVLAHHSARAALWGGAG